jgi:hypothetical protein
MTTWGEYTGPIKGFVFEQKAPQDAIIGIPQEKFTGDVMKGRGPRRGNLERLLRYWRPIMKREGGFRRCKVILADHPELYPLNNICAWLHHETTGLWPNEGCHHPGMKNCRRKIKKGINGSLWSDDDFSKRIANRAKPDGKSASMDDNNYDDVITQEDESHASLVAKTFASDEQEFYKMLSDTKNWVQEGESEDGTMEVEYDGTEKD